ncbi:MAG: glycosyltransferase 87 family protein, partial [Sandaracinaceae bacterium]|nr:glycosyltransferase 87 family protein [Sandaracinaceae bacterium]
MPAPHTSRSRVALAIALLAFVAALASVSAQLTPNTWIFRDGRFYVNVTTTIVEDLSLEQHRFAASWYSGTLGWNHDLDPGWSNVALGRNGEHWPKHPYVLPFLASPLYFALGLPATLLFNLMMYGVMVAGLYRFARAYAEPESAALAASLFVFATIVVGSAYDYSTDVLMLALFAQGLASVKERRGIWAGVAMGLCVMIKPTALMLLPSLVLVFFERTEARGAAPDRDRTRRELFRSLAGGATVLVLFALANTWMYGRPWWSGYNRTLVTSGGAPSLASHTDAFGVPFEEGLHRVLYGDYGLVAAFGILALAAPGLLVMLRRRPRAAIAAILGVTLSLEVFSRYVYEGHRFHWPALALLVPAIATTFAWLGRREVRPIVEAARRVRVGEGVLVGGAALAATMFTVIGSPRGRLGGGAWVDAALGAVPESISPEVAPFLVIALHGVFAGVLAGALASMVSGPRALRAAAVLVPLGAPEVRLGLQQGGPALIATALVALACALLMRSARQLGERGSL